MPVAREAQVPHRKIEVDQCIRPAMSSAWFRAIHEFRYGCRRAKARPLHAITLICVVALGTSVPTAVFILANWLFVRPIAGVADPEHLVTVRFERAPGQGTRISNADMHDLLTASPALAGMAAWDVGTNLHAKRPDGPSFVVRGTVVQGDYFGVLGIIPQTGRTFTTAELLPHSTDRVAVVSDALWRAQWARAPDVVGTTFVLNAKPYTVVGVAPRGFHGTDKTAEVDVWVPLPVHRELQYRSVDLSQRGPRAAVASEAIARLTDNATPQLAQEQLRTAMSNLVKSHPLVNAIYKSNIPTVYSGVGLPPLLRTTARDSMAVMLGIASLFWLLAVGNMTTLFLLRGVDHSLGDAIRLVLGATRASVIRESCVEAMLLMLLGGILGSGIAYALSHMLVGTGLFGLPVLRAPAFDWRVLSFVLGTAVIAGVFVAVVSELSSTKGTAWSRTQVASAGGRTPHGGSLRNVLVVLQIAGAVTILSGAFLLVATMSRLQTVQLGYRTEDVWVFGYNPAPQGYDGRARASLDNRVLQHVASLPGVASASLASSPPMNVGSMRYVVSSPDGNVEIEAEALEVTGRYFDTLGIRILDGRVFTAREELAPLNEKVGAILSASAAKGLFGGERAVGRTVRVKAFVVTDQPVVGVTEDVRLRGYREGPTAAIYLPLGAAWQPARFLLVRSAPLAKAVGPAVASAMQRVDRLVPLFRAEPLSDGLARTIAEERLLARLLDVCSALAITLAAVGVYGVTACSVAQRRRDIGINIALGASYGAVVSQTMRHAATIFLGGAALGCVGAYSLSQLIASRLFGATSADSISVGAALALMAVTVMTASARPAMQAARVDVVAVLKSE